MDERWALLGMALVDGVGPLRMRALLDKFKSAAAAWENRREWRAVPGIGPVITRAALKVTEEDVERQRRALEALGARFITDEDPEWPEGLRHVTPPPKVLFVRGRLPRGFAESVAIVGSRKASAGGMKVAREMGRDLAAVGVVVVSGLARGIDGAAHRGALDARGRTVAVLGCGLDIAYPPEHRSLMEEIAAQGALVSEYPLGQYPKPSHFPARNRIIAGLSRAVVLLECGPESGALHTVHFALDLGRDVMAVPGDVHRWHSAGPNELIRQGATLVRNAADVLSELGWTVMPAPAAGDGWSLRGPGGGPERFIAALKEAGPLSVDELAGRTGAPVEEAAAAVTWLEVLGRVRREPGGRFAAYD